MNQPRPFRKPPDVEEALSSMLWTPYDNNASDSDSSPDEDQCMPADPATTPGRHCNNNSLQPSSTMKRSYSEWNYCSPCDNSSSKAPLIPATASDGAGNRYSYPYYSIHPAVDTVGAGCYWNSNNIYTDGFPGPSAAANLGTTIFPTMQTGPLLDYGKPIRSMASSSAVPMSSSLPFSLLSMDSIPVAVGGTVPITATYGFYETDLINSNIMFGINDTFVDYQQVYPSTPIAGGSAYLRAQQSQRHFSSMSSSSSSSAASGCNLVNDNNNNNNNYYSYDNNDNGLCRISAILKPVMRSNSGNVGDLHFSKHQQQQRPRSEQHTVENATGSSSTNTNTNTQLQDEHHRHVGCSRNERTKWNQQNMGPLNGYHHSDDECEGAAVEAADGARLVVDGRDWRTAPTSTAVPMNGSDRAPFSSVRIVNGEAYAYSDLAAPERRLFAATDRPTIDRIFSASDNNSRSASGSSSRALDNLRDFGRSVRDRFVDIMRLNVPAAPEGSRTSVYIPSSDGTTVTDGAISHGEGGPRPTLTIQVNRVDTNNQEQNDVVNNASSGVSIVNCYRGAPKSAADPSEDPECTVVSTGPDVPEESQFSPSDVNSADLNPTIIDKNHSVNSSANEEQMVHVSNTVVQSDPNLIEHSYNVKNSAKNQTTSYKQTDIDRIEPAGNRTYISTEAQTEDPSMIASFPHPAILTGGIPHPPSHPSLMLATPVGSEFSTREHRRRERRERRQARNRMQHVHPLDQPPPPPTMIRPPPIEIIPDILHSHLPPPYTTLPLGATVLPAPMLPAVPVHHRGAADDCRYSFPIPIIRSSPSERSRKGCCGHWFAGPPLRALIAVVALGGVACALGGAALGATGLAGSPTSHLTAALLMIGVGVILVTVSGAAWRMTAPGAPPCLGLGSTVDLGRCSRRPCGRGGSTPHGLLYPEFQHRPPPPSYQASMQEYRLRLLLLDRDRQSGRMRSTASPPPTYRSNVGSLLRIPLTTRYSNGASHVNGGPGGGTVAGAGCSTATNTSIFGGISGIISGAMGSSTNSINATAQSSPPINAEPGGANQADPLVAVTEPGGGILPPTYRTIDRRNSSASVISQAPVSSSSNEHQVQIRKPPPPLPPPPSATTSTATTTKTTATTTPPVTKSIRGSGAGLMNDDNIVSTPGQPTVAGRTPSIIKIDDGKSTTRTAAAVTAGGADPVTAAAAAVQRKQRKSITNEIIESDGSTAGENAPNKDLVTIVTISGTLEQPKPNKSVYDCDDSAPAPVVGLVPGIGTGKAALLNPVKSLGSGAVAHL
ncbi:uncharacterized protein LOC131436051 [Malaya genurostris]|uniref:uncharacterized protein LOC131436051 n=1 Tax=Malaya genurostris TaxID=325434 RepID=UPI0026F3CFD9|nr:uncharacterized protein LOC131436051 [Malaya genurostris]XP_058460478.1 uncharacterized protein LOC131436051 [Malaya genurostris]XP_058460479.1 uncharacterized protein LOC131436051 [Malaya genurostris]XP_058460480.1 uncharacterized protein LOC131436051 [Malaya genurostris]